MAAKRPNAKNAASGTAAARARAPRAVDGRDARRSHKRGAAAPTGQVPFAQKLILNQWLLSLFGVKKFDELALPLRSPDLEGRDESNVHRFHHVLTAQFPRRPELPDDLLLQYDQNIARHTDRLNEARRLRGLEPIRWKYFQYLALLFTEIYLDRYFTDPAALRSALNRQIAAYNEGKAAADRLPLFDEAAEPGPQLNKLAFWMATGSGKTLLMHMNILQYQHYLERHRRRGELSRILLLTPDEGLSRQHLRDFAASGIDAELFDKDRVTLFSRHFVQIIDIHKLKDESGEKTVAVDAFEGNNLVLVDEGHRGASSGDQGAWMHYRNRLCEQGFSFEYSATFGQAVKESRPLTELYARSILFDYSYRYFYEDGFGKEYLIFNLDSATERNQLELYLVAGLLDFFQKLRLFRDRRDEFRPFLVEKPLWVFVGSSVTRGLSASEASDIVEILLFLERYLRDARGSTERIRRLLEEGLVTADGHNLFEGRFTYLSETGLSPEALYRETLDLLFHAPGGGALRLENLRGAPGEIALQVGENPPFGVINVGEPAKLCRLCEEHGLDVAEAHFRGSLFHDINSPESTIHLLIGARKFTEGWNSWRVSTMGLMNVGRSEGAQVIQLFGRGVRLRGYGESLKRSGYAPIPEGVAVPRHIDILETLSIFGIRADYMAQFREFLAEEGLDQGQREIRFRLPVRMEPLPAGLKTIRLRPEIEGVATGQVHAFRRLGPRPVLAGPGGPGDRLREHLQQYPVELNLYPKIRAMKSRGLAGGEAEARPNVAHLGPEQVAFLNLDRLYCELERYKAERGYHNLTVPRRAIQALLGDPSWYRLLIPAEELEFTGFAQVRLWEEIALSLLKKYMDRFYALQRAAWESHYLEYRPLDSTDPNLSLGAEGAAAPCYTVTLPAQEAELAAQLQELKRQIQRGTLDLWQRPFLKAVRAPHHLYYPLLHLTHQGLQVSPAPLNRGEWQFVQDLEAFCRQSPELLAGRQLYLLRNQSRGRGLGFFEAGNFYPDFILWVVDGGRQQIVFIDPKGIRNLTPSSPKIRFHETIKQVERRLGDPTVRLESFILSVTPYGDVASDWPVPKPELQRMHVLFQEDPDYVRTLLQMVGAVPEA